MELLTKDFNNAEKQKANLLMSKAVDLDMDFTCYGELARNNSNGNIYLWLEDYDFSLFIRPCESDQVEICWTDMIDGNEEIVELKESIDMEWIETWIEYNRIKYYLGTEHYCSLTV